MEVINKYRKKIIVICVIIEIILVPLIVRNIISLKNKDNNDNNIPSENEIGKQEFGIMYRDNDTDSYKAYSGSIIDAINNSYELNLTNSKCSDGSGATVTPSSVLSINGSTVTIKSNKTVYCTLYFDLKKSMTALELLKSKPKDLSPTIQGDMYRYQAAPASANEAAKMTNWICFGTTENCGENNELIDKYMYRIIGITSSGEMKLIKETFIKEGSTSGFSWNDRYSVDSTSTYYCPDGKCPDWPESELFKRLNGTSNGKQTGNGETLDKEWTDIFVDSEQYDYLRSGDGKNGGTSASSWYNLISDHQWLYGDTKDTSALNKYNGDAMYAIESGAIDTTHYVGTKGNITSETYNWKDNPPLTAKIGLMYWYDYYYSYYDGADESTRGNAGAYSKLTNAWLHFRRDGYNTSTSCEWLMSRWGVYSTSSTSVYAFGVYYDGDWYRNYLIYTYGVRPVFYLSSTAKILGDGTKSSPYKVINN